MNSFDNIAGGTSGANVLNGRITNINANTLIAPVVSNVQTVNLTNITAANVGGLNLISATGVTNANVVNTTTAGSTTAFTNIAATGVTVGLDNADTTSNFNFQGAAARTGTADAFSASISNGSGTAAAAAVLNITTAAFAADATFEVVNVTTAGAGSFVDLGLGDASYRVINVSGTASAAATASAGAVQTYGLQLSDANGSATALRTINASGMTGTGGLSIDASGATFTGFAFTGSAGNDRVVLNQAIANAPNTFALNGGTGGTNDVLAISTVALTVAAAPSTVTTLNAATGFETIELTSAVVTGLDANAVDYANFAFTGTSAAKAASIATTNVRTGDTFTITQDWNVVLADDVDVFTFAGAVAGQSATVNLVGDVDITVDIAAAGGSNANALTFNNGITTVNLVSNNINGSAAAADNSIQAATGVASIDNASAANFVASGAAPLTIGATAGIANPLGFTQAVSFDGSALTGILRIGGSAAADAIIGGSAADIIYGLGGNDELTGNSGNDQFRYIAAANGTDTITDFAAGDAIGTNFIAFANTTATQAGAVVNALDYSDVVNAITGITAGNDLQVVELQTAQTAAQLATAVSAGAADALVLVFNSTTGFGEVWYDTNWNNDANRTQIATLENVTTLAQLVGLSNANFVDFAV